MKIFGIGLSKTGTSSLAHALEILGYRTKDNPGIARYQPGDVTCVDPDLVQTCDALTDTPIPSFYRELDQAFPGSRFILTIRDMDGWLLSCKKQFTQRLADAQNDAHSQLFMDLYGTVVFDVEKFRAGYERFVKGVQDHFKDRPQDLLILNVTAGEGWEKLCPFLGKPVPDLPFPKANVTRIRWMDVHSLDRMAREAGDKLLPIHRALRPLSETPAWQERIVSLPRRVMYALGGGRDHALSIAVKEAERALSRSFARLNADIPVVFRTSSLTPYEVRKNWNHFWLVDPIDGEAAFGAMGNEFTVNIALIEDQKPIAGVVYAPVSGTLYYAMSGKGAFKVEAGGQPVRIQAPDAGGGESPRQAADNPPATSKALMLCRIAEGMPGTDQGVNHCMEWQSAAAHAVAGAVGKRIRACNGGAELTYNKPDWSSECVTVS